MPARVTLHVEEGTLDRREYVFEERNSLLVGRGEDCYPRVPNTREYNFVSRLHCLLDINPPDVRIRDYGSLNGTHINGQVIGKRTRDDQRGTPFPEHDLRDGDEVMLGSPRGGKAVVFRVAVSAPPAGAQAARPCVKCGKDVADEAGGGREGDYVCAACRGEPLPILARLLEMARSGDPDLVAVQGYEIERELGRGGMGAVYLARHGRAGGLVALKVMLPRVRADGRATQRFLREAELTRALVHPNVVRLHDHGCSRGTFFLTLEYCDGGSVARLMEQEGGPLSVARAGAITLQVLAGLEYAHGAQVPVRRADGSTATRCGLVHRDLKPANIFLSGRGGAQAAKVGDYGLAKAFDDAGLSGQTRTGSTAGTPHFMPRQQVVNFKYAQPEVDVWAAAACLYYMLTGQTPRDFPEGRDRWQVALQERAVPIRQRTRAIPAKLAEVIDHALTDKPVIGFRTAAELRQALEGAL
jgi:hypothetical protein